MDEQFTELFRDLAPEVRRWAVRRLGQDYADDIVDETFGVVWRRWEHLPQSSEHRRAWVFTIARHKANHVRAELMRAPAALESATDGPWLSVPDCADQVIASLTALALLNGLGPVDRVVLVLVAGHGMGTAEAAREFGCSRAAMSTRLSRARARVRAASREDLVAD